MSSVTDIPDSCATIIASTRSVSFVSTAAFRSLGEGIAHEVDAKIDVRPFFLCFPHLGDFRNYAGRQRGHGPEFGGSTSPAHFFGSRNCRKVDFGSERLPSARR